MPVARHGFPAKIRIPRHKAPVHVRVKNGVPCDEVIDVIVPSRTTGMRDWRRRPTRCEEPGKAQA
jgi:hypothetical protein